MSKEELLRAEIESVLARLNSLCGKDAIEVAEYFRDNYPEELAGLVPKLPGGFVSEMAAALTTSNFERSVGITADESVYLRMFTTMLYIFGNEMYLLGKMMKEAE